MKSLRVKLLYILVLVPMLTNLASGAPSQDFSEMSYTEMIKSSAKVSAKCNKQDLERRDQVKSIISSYLNELNYRCTKVSSYSKEATTCKLTKFRLKSDYMSCDKDDYYYNKIESYYF